MARKTKIFTIYAWEDKNAMLNLLRHLKPLEKDFDLSFWNDDPIRHGQQWMPEDESRLNEADIFLLLISADFMNSEFIKQLEFKNIIDRYKENESVVIPIILEYCQWEIDFKSDDYDFNLNELQVLPDGGKPLENWSTPDLAFKDITNNIKKVLNSFLVDDKGFEIEDVTAVSDANGKDQMAMDFNKESEIKKNTEEGKNTKEELESNITTEEEQRLETAKKAEEELKLAKEAEEKLRAAEEERLLKEDEARRRVEQGQEESAKEVIERKRIAEEKRLLEEAETQKRIEEEKRINEEIEAEAKRIEEKNRLIEEEYQEQYSSEPNENSQQPQSEGNANTRKRILAGGLIALLAIVGIWAFSKFNKGIDEPESYLPNTDEVEVKGPPASSDEIEIDFAEEEKDFSKMLVGDTHDGGIIFTIDYISKTGKIAHIDDAGPMPWKEAMKINEKLGEGWRLPTMDELRLMHKSIGQGSDNKGEFADELYWSATAYDSNQARLVRFRDGNTSYHYNSGGAHRKFLVRAIRDFNR